MDNHNACETAWLNGYKAGREAVEKKGPIDVAIVVRCKDCKHWHKETSWCTIHSHFVDDYGMACHPWESADWKMLQDNDFCSYGERRTGCD